FARNTVHFTCTPTNLPGRPTTTSKFSESPSGLAAGKSLSAASAINRNSTHSPRFFLSGIFPSSGILRISPIPRPTSPFRLFTSPAPSSKFCHSESWQSHGEEPAFSQCHPERSDFTRKASKKSRSRGTLRSAYIDPPSKKRHPEAPRFQVDPQ